MAPSVTWGTVKTGTAGGAQAANMPASIAAGDLLVLAVACDSTTAPTTPAGWTLIDGGANTAEQYTYGKIAAGSDTVTITLPAQDFVMVCGKITGHGVSNVARDIRKGTAATGSTAAADPPNCASTSVAQDYLAIALCSLDLTTGNTISAVPSGYTSAFTVTTVSASSTSSVALGCATKALTGATSENPAAFTNTSRAWRAQTLLIPPPGTTDSGSAQVTSVWTDSNGAAWPSPWSHDFLSSGSTATVQTNRGRHALAAVGSYGAGAVSRVSSTYDDLGILVDFVVASTANECYQRVYWRDAGDQATQYGIELGNNSKVISAYRQNSSFVKTTLGANETISAITAGTVVHVRAQMRGTALKARWWLDSETEPQQWQVEVTDSTLTAAGIVGVSSTGGTNAVATNLDFDNFTLYTFVATGSAANTLGSFTSSSSGGTGPAATAAQTLGAFVSAASGSTVHATAAQTLAAFTSSATGSFTGSTVTGSAANTLAAFTSAASAGHGVAGSSARTLAPFSSAATGTFTPPTVTGTAAQTLSGFVSAATGSTVRGTATNTLGAFTSAATAAHGVAGTSARTLSAFTSTASGTFTPSGVTGTAAQTLNPFTSTASGSSTRATAANTLGGFTSTATGGHGPKGTAASTLGAFLSAAGGSSTAGTVASTLAAFVSTATGTHAVGATAVLVLGGFASEAEGSVGTAVEVTVYAITARGVIYRVGPARLIYGAGNPRSIYRTGRHRSIYDANHATAIMRTTAARRPT